MLILNTIVGVWSWFIFNFFWRLITAILCLLFLFIYGTKFADTRKNSSDRDIDSYSNTSETRSVHSKDPEGIGLWLDMKPPKEQEQKKEKGEEVKEAKKVEEGREGKEEKEVREEEEEEEEVREEESESESESEEEREEEQP